MFRVTLTETSNSISLYTNSLNDITVLKNFLKRFDSVNNITFELDAEETEVIIEGEVIVTGSAE